MTTRTKSTIRRRNRTRFSVKAAAHGRPRLSVFRSGRHIYAQIIADADGKTLAAASSIDEVGLSRKPTSAGSLAALKLGRAPQISLQLLSLV